ncbi:MAG: hypothetical protein Q4B59_04500 [Lachnospiraceae bacterium]|nr:hypothetical protein [Lachnospiraceae bacterium]
MKRYCNQEINERIRFLQSLIRDITQSLKQMPDGMVRGSKHGKGWQYYFRKNKADKNGKYIPKKQMKLAMALGQKEYDQRVIKAAQAELRELIRLQKISEKGLVEDKYEQLTKGIQALVTPVEKPIEEFLQEWMKQPYESKEFAEGAPEFYSEKGERMRSKSEVFIANLLHKYDIPYLYEKPLYLNGFGLVHPDFTLMSRRRREEIYLEHFGMLDDAEYTDKFVQKLFAYEKNGFFLGERLLMTYETGRMQLNMRVVEEHIRHIAEIL